MLLLTNLVAPVSSADYSGADYEVGEDGVIYSRFLIFMENMKETFRRKAFERKNFTAGTHHQKKKA